MTLRVFTVAALTLALLFWLARNPSPADTRRNRINVSIRNGDMGKLDGALEARLKSQFKWLSIHAGFTAPLAVNQELRRGQITVVVTTPKFEQLTGCGSGNAIFDPALDAIFIDQSLVNPVDLAVIGSKGPYSMSSVETFGFVASYASFVLAHELGHRHARKKAAAFFYYGLNSPDGGTLQEEEAADRFP